MTLTMCKGLPAAGKSTWAKAQNAYRVNKDDLRAMMNNGKWSKINEAYILKVRDAIIELHLLDKNDVIVDDTNLALKHEATLRILAMKHEAGFVVKDFTDVDPYTCIERDAKRPNPVGHAVIMRMYRKYLQPKPPVYDPALPRAIICDLDGTLCLFGDKNPYDRDFENDICNPAVKSILLNQETAECEGVSPVKVILLSGRKGQYREQTVEFLSKNDLYAYRLFMRPNDDTRKDAIVKKEMYDQYIFGKYNVLYVLDDRDQVVRLWRSLGLPCLQVNEGDF